MQADFWHRRWQHNEIGFHTPTAHPMLVAHLGALALPPHSRIFVPLCGKTLDIHWLLAQGWRVAGAELSPLAVEQLFAELGVQPTITALDPEGALQRHSAPHIDIFVGDLFELSPEVLGPVDAVYDRAALVALPPEMRPRYAAHLLDLTVQAPQLLVTFDYDQALQPGPPFSVPAAEVAQHYGQAFTPRLLASEALPGGLKGQCPAQEETWLLAPAPASA